MTPSSHENGDGEIGASGRRVGPYRIIEELGRGSQGQVYLAEDSRLSRRVALKVLSASFVPSSSALHRFQREAAAASKLDHPGICSIYEAGTADGVPYIAMRHIEGETLAKQIASSREKAVTATETLAAGSPDPPAASGDSTASGSGVPPSSREEILGAVHLIERAARALHSAHEAGLIHRDIKPGNIMVTHEGDPVILDFGLARDVDSDVQTITHSGDLLGTPAYMSPEQLLAQRIPLDRRTDIYSLGVTLYERLTLQRPFDAPTREGLYQKILAANPVDPRRLNSHIPRDLKVVLETALERDRGRRYKTAFDFAEDLRRVRSYEPIKARPAGPIIRFQRWTQRNPVLATATLGLFLLLASGLAISLILLRKVEEEREAAKKESTEKAIALTDREAALSAVKAESIAKEEALRRAEGLYLTAQASSALRDNPGLALILAIEGARRQPGSLSRNILLEALQTCREVRTLIGHDGPVLDASFSPDGTRAITCSEDRTARIWNAATGQSLATLRGHQGFVTGARLGPDGRRAATSSADGTGAVWDVASGRRVAILRGHRQSVLSVAFSPDGDRVLTASRDGTARVWEASTGKEVAIFGGNPQDSALEAAWSPDGRRVLTVGEIPWPARTGMSALRVWDAQGGAPLAVLSGHEGRISTAIFRPDGKRIFTASADQSARFWSPETGEQIEMRHGFGVELTDAAFSSDGRLVVVAGTDGKAHVWEEASGKPIAVLEGHTKSVRLVRFVPGGRIVLTAADDATARLWDASTGKEVARFLGHQGPLASATFNADGDRVITASRDGTARIWDANPQRGSAGVFRAPDREVHAIHFSPDGGRILFLGSPAADSTLIDAATRAAVAELRDAKGFAFLSGEDESMATALFSPDGRWALTASSTGVTANPSSVAIWDARTGSEVATSYGLYDADFTADGGRLLAHFSNASSGIFKLEEGRGLLQDFIPADFTLWTSNISCSSSGQRAAVSSVDSRNTVWRVSILDTESFRQQCSIQVSSSRASALAALSPSGDRLLTVFPDGKIVMRSTAGGQIIAEFRARSSLAATQWSADGGKILALGIDRTARVLDAASGTVLGQVGGRGVDVLAAAFDPTAERIIALHGDAAPTVWRWATGEKVAELAGHRGPVTSAAFGPDGLEIATSSEDRTARIWNASSGAERQRLEGHADAVLSAAFDPAGRRVITASADHTARIWDASSGAPLATMRKKKWSVPIISSRLWNFASTESALFSPDGRLLLVTSADEGKIWDGRQGKLLAQIGGERGCVITAAAFRRDGKWVATGHGTPRGLGTIQGRSTRRGEPPALLKATDPFVRIWDADGGRVIATLRGLGEPPSFLCFSPSGRSILGAAASGPAFIWDTETGKTTARFRFPATVLSVEFNPQGDRLLAISGSAAQIWSVAEGSPIATLTGHTDALTSGCFSPDGELVVTSSVDGTARIWSAATGGESVILRGHRGRVNSAEWSPSGRWVVTASEDKTVRLWDVAKREEVIALPHLEPVIHAAIGSGGDKVLTVSRDMSARVWPVELVADLVAAGDARRPRELTPDEVASLEMGSADEQAAYRRKWLLERAYSELEAAERKLDRRSGSEDVTAEIATCLTRIALALEGRTPEKAREALERAERAVLAAGRSSPEVLGALAAIQAESGRLRDSVLTLEEAAELPEARASLHATLDARRREVFPDIASYASIDAAIDAPDTIAIIPERANWRYFPGRSEPSGGLEWTTAAFDDSAWPSGPSGFGFADGDDATVLGDMEGAYTTVYVRHAFEAPAGGDVEKVILSIRADDGFVAYLNGKEIHRLRAPPRARVPFDGIATTYAREPLELTEVMIDPGLILPGRNLLAIQGLNHNVTSTDFSLIPVLIAERRKDAGTIKARFEAFRRVATGDDAPARLAYVEARILEGEGKRDEAARALEGVIAADPTRPQPYLRLAEALRASRDAAAAETWLRKAIEAGATPAGPLWDRWLSITAVDFKRDARQILDAMPGKGVLAGPGADIRWALERIAAEATIRILCGGEERRDSAGALWGRDRFHLGVSEASTVPGDDFIHETERRFLAGGGRPPGYRVPVPIGRYRVTIHVPQVPGGGVRIEPVGDTRPASRLFEVLIEGRPVTRLGTESGSLPEGAQAFETDVTDGFLEIELVPRTGEPALSALVIERR